MESLDWLEWECKSSLEIDVTQHGAFPQSVERVELSRKSDLALVAIGKGAGSFNLSEYIHLRPGEFSPYPEETIGQTKFGESVRIKGVLLRASSDTLSHPFPSELDSFSIQAQVDEFEISQCELHIVTHIEWIVNFSINNYTFTRYTQRKQSIVFTRERSGGDRLQRNLSCNDRPGNLDHFGCECTVGDKRWLLLVGQVPEEIGSTEYKPGFIEFYNLNDCIPSEDTKRIILAALSFTLGRQIASVGSTSLAEDGDRVSYSTKTVRLLGEQSAYRQPSYPPTQLSLPDYDHLEGVLDEKKVSKIISAVATKMEELNLEYPLFLVWLGQNSPREVRAAHLGAAIESLRDSYCENNLRTNLLPTNLWKEIMKPLLIEAFDNAHKKLELNLQISSEVKILRDKLSQLNDKSSNMKYDEFFELISLKNGKVEKAALRERNKPAHGTRYLPNQYRGLSITTDALYTLFNRIVLKLTDASDYYIDYSTYGYPVRYIDEPLGGPEGDGRAAIV
jgi:hypothetical protein